MRTHPGGTTSNLFPLSTKFNPKPNMTWAHELLDAH